MGDWFVGAYVSLVGVGLLVVADVFARHPGWLNRYLPFSSGRRARAEEDETSRLRMLRVLGVALALGGAVVLVVDLLAR